MFRFCRATGLVAVALLTLAGCMTPPTDPPPPGSGAPPSRDINLVLQDHDQEFMALPGVVGVYIGLLPDGRTPCLKVMLARPDPKALARIPHRLEGYAVVTEVTGEIRPLGP
ncbi:MAG: hypothetical protein RJA22_231 [Verrucomicrobiota bacterium]|jgi:hypothetical protein